MLRLFTRHLPIFQPLTTPRLTHLAKLIKPTHLFRTVTFASLPLMMHLNHSIYCLVHQK